MTTAQAPTKTTPQTSSFELPKTVTEKQFHQAVGRRKTSTATVRIWSTSPEHSVSTGLFVINGKSVTDYFPQEKLQQVALSPLSRIKSLEKFAVSAKVSGGGPAGQAEAIRHGLSRSLVEFFPNFRKKLKKAQFLTRDARMKERKKPGLKKARKAPQWSKR